MGNKTSEVSAVPVDDPKGAGETAVVTVDSGAYTAVGPPCAGTDFPVKPAEASSKGRRCSAANGTAFKFTVEE